jgi:hypothetical protein
MARERSKLTEGARSQIERFREAARELGCEEDEEAFDKALKKIASEKPPASVQKRKKLQKPPRRG